MTLLARMLCRLWRGAAPGPCGREGTAEKTEANRPEEISPDDLTAIRGIGKATQNRLHTLARSRQLCYGRGQPGRAGRAIWGISGYADTGAIYQQRRLRS